MSTITVPSKSSLGAFSTEISDRLSTDGNKDSTVANAVVTLATQAQTDIVALESPTTVTYGDPAAGYTPPDNTWWQINGVSPPTLAALRFQDQVTGTYFIVTSQNGVLTIAPE